MTTLFNYDPYYDDFDEDKNFMRILFRPGYAVQARELTQLQTILANQIEKFGNHIFKSGTPIIGGKVSLNSSSNFISLKTQYLNEDINADDFLNKTILCTTEGTTKRVRARVIDTVVDQNETLLIINYLSGDRFESEDIIKVYGSEVYAQIILEDTATNQYATGGSYTASIGEGIFYFKGQFVKVTSDIITVVPKYRLGDSLTINQKPNAKIGIQFTEQIIDEIDDTSLLDPALGSSNYQAPGADRFQVITELVTRTLDSIDLSSFFELMRLENGVKTKEVNTPVYSDIANEMARRTYDESGNYTIDPFVISLEEGDSANGNFNVVLDPGKAYVGGYEFQTIAPTTIEVSRARETATANGRLISPNYESSVVLANTYGALDVSSYPSLDIHCVPHSNVNVSATAAYNSTKIGTLRANMLQYNDSTDSDNGNTYTFTVNVFDVETAPITGTLVSGSTTTVIKLPADFSSTVGANAYANMYFSITDGAGLTVSPILISESDDTANTVTLSEALAFTPGTNTFSIDSSFDVAESIATRSGVTKTFGADIDADSKNSLTGFAYISEPSKTATVFAVPEGAIAQGTISDLDFYALEKVTVTDITENIYTIETNEQLAFSSISDSIIRENIICFVNTTSSSNTTYGIYPGKVLALSNNNFTLAYVDENSFTVTLNAVPSSTYYNLTFFVKVFVNNATQRNKSLLPSTTGFNLHSLIPFEMDTGGTEGSTVLYDANTSTVTAFSGGKIFEDIGATNFTDTTTLKSLRTAGTPVDLGISDVLEIVRITDSKDKSANVTSAMLTNSEYDITSHYTFDNGQKNSYYDHATITLKRGYSAPQGTVFVQYKYFKPAAGITSLFTVDSYPVSSYADIPVYNNREIGRLIPLNSSFDFRPVRASGDSTTISGAYNVIPTDEMEVNYEYYLSRIDKVVVSKDRRIKVINGKSDINPLPPVESKDDMLIYTLYIPAYTSSTKYVRADFSNHRRYTMDDIGKFEDRIKRLEYYVALNALEKDAVSQRITDANGLERSKYGIVVDNFTTEQIKAPRSEVGEDNSCLIGNGTLEPPSLMRTEKINLNKASLSGNYKISGSGEDDQVATLSYTTTSMATQPFASKSIPVANALFANFRGSLKLVPEFNAEVDTETNAKVTLDSGNMQSAFDFINESFKYIADNEASWANDKDSPFAQIPDSKYYRTEVVTSSTSSTQIVDVSRARAGEWLHELTTTTTIDTENKILSAGSDLSQKQISVKASEQTVGNFVTDLAIQPYAKSARVIFASENVRPKTQMYAFFDNVDVNQYVVVPNQVTLNAQSQLITGETVLIATTTADLAANLSSYNTGGTSYKEAFVVGTEPTSNTILIVNESGESMNTASYNKILGVTSGKYYTIDSITEHRSGVGTASGSSITLAGDASSTDDYYNGNTVTIVHATNTVVPVGEEYTISDYNGTTKVATLASTVTTTGSVVYSIGNMKSTISGDVGGAFYIPQATFRSGERILRITESFNNSVDADAISFAQSTYVSSGIVQQKTPLVNTVYTPVVATKVVDVTNEDQVVDSKIIGSTVTTTLVALPEPDNSSDIDSDGGDGGDDPLAQTFFVDAGKYPNGIFLESIDLFFKGKDDELPVTIDIRPTVNGFPHSSFIYPESITSLKPSDVVVSETPSVNDSDTYTSFTMKSPVYLKPGMYAFVVSTNSPEYITWAAEKGATSINNEFISKNPFVGTLYKSVSAKEFTPFLNEDLMFRLNICSFDSSCNFVLKNDAQDSTVNIDKFRLLETSVVPNATRIDHAVRFTSINSVKETNYRNITPKTIISFENDRNYTLGNKRKIISAYGDLDVRYTLSTTDKYVSPIVSLSKSFINIWENFVDNGGIDADKINIIEEGGGYSNANTISITSSTGTGASINIATNANGNVIGVTVNSQGSGYVDDFTISYYENPTNPAEIVLNSEYDSSGGQCDAKYITKKIVLAPDFDAGDLRVYLALNRPFGTEIDVYCKIRNSSDATDFRDRSYQKLVCVNPPTAYASSPDEFIELEYAPSIIENQITYVSEDGVTHDTFKDFSIKIVMRSQDPAIVPKVRDLRIIALPAE